jgi:hypothetical protein
MKRNKAPRKRKLTFASYYSLLSCAKSFIVPLAYALCCKWQPLSARFRNILGHVGSLLKVKHRS